MDIIRKRITRFTKLPVLAVLALMAVAAGIGYAAATATPEAEAQTTATAPQVASIQLWHNDPGKWTYRPGDVATIRVTTDIPLSNRVVTPDLRRDNWINAYNGDRHIRFNLARIVGSDLYYQRTVTADDVNFAPSGFATFGSYSTDPQGPVAGGQAASGICSQAAGPDCPAEAQFGWKLKNTRLETNLGNVASRYLQISNTAPNFTLASDTGIQLLVDPQMPHRYLEANEPVSLQVQLSDTNLYPRQHIPPAMADANYVTLTVGKNTTAKAKLSSIGNNYTGGYLVYTYLTQASDYAGYGANDFIPGVTLNAASQAASSGICAQADGNTCAGDYQLQIARILPAAGITSDTQLVQTITPMDYTVSFPDDIPTSIDIASHTPYTAANGPELPLATVNHGELSYQLNTHSSSQSPYPSGMKLVQKADKLVFTGVTDNATTSTRNYRFTITATAQDGVTSTTSDPIDLRIVSRIGPVLSGEVPDNINVYLDWFRTGDSYVFPDATTIDDATLTYDLVKWPDAAGKTGQFTADTHSNLVWDQDTGTLSHADPANHDRSKMLAHNTPYVYMLRVRDGKGGFTERKFTITIKERPAVKEVTLNTPADGKYTAGDTINATATFWDANVGYVNPYSQVKVGVAASPAPQPYLNLQIGDHIRQAALVNPNRRADSVRHQLRFSYTVTEADRDTNGISIAADALQNTESIVGTETGFTSPVRSVIPNAFTDSINLRVNGPTYEGVTVPSIKLYRDGYQQSAVLPEPADVAPDTTYTLTETDSTAREHAGVLFNSTTRMVSIGTGSKPRQNVLTRTTVHQYRLTATDPATNTSVSVTVPIGFASRPEAVAYTIAGPDKPNGQHDTNTYQPGANIEIRINYNAPIHKPATSPAEDNTLQILVGTETRDAKFLRTDNISAKSIGGAGAFDYDSQAVFGYTLRSGDNGRITVPTDGLNAPGIIGDATHAATGQNEPVSSKLPPSLNSASFYGKSMPLGENRYDNSDAGPYGGVNEVSATPSTITYSGVANPVINLYRDGHPDTYGTNVLPAPANATAGMTYTLTEANGDPVPAGLIFNAGTREVSIGTGLKPPKSGQYRITAVDNNVNANVYLDVTIRYVTRPQPVAYTIAGPRKPDGKHDRSTYQPGDTIEFRINYGTEIVKTADFAQADNYLPFLIGTGKREAKYTRLDNHVVENSGETDWDHNRQLVFSYTLATDDSGVISIPEAGPHAPGIAGGTSAASLGRDEVISPHLPAGLNGGNFYGKHAEGGGLNPYPNTPANQVTAVPNALTYDGVDTPSALTIYTSAKQGGGYYYTPPAPRHAVAPLKDWHITPKATGTEDRVEYTPKTGGIIHGNTTAPATTYVVTATDSRGLSASFEIVITITQPQLLTPTEIYNRPLDVAPGDVAKKSHEYFTTVGANITWTLVYPQDVTVSTAAGQRPKLRLQIGKHLREAVYQGLASSKDGAHLRFTYNLQSTDMDDEITIADPPLANPESITAVINGDTAIANNNRSDTIWNWPAGQENQFVKVDGGTAGPSFPSDTPSEIILLQNTQYRTDADQLYLRNTLPAATSPTILNYGPLTYSVQDSLIAGNLNSGAYRLLLTVKNGVPTITTGNHAGAPPYDAPSSEKVLVATDFRGRKAYHTFKIHHERAIMLDPHTPAVYGTNDLIRVFVRHGQELSDAQKAAAATATMRITTGADRGQPDQTWQATYNAAESTKEQSVYVYQIQAADQEASLMHITVSNVLNHGIVNWNDIPVQINPDGPPRWTDIGYGNITCHMTMGVGGECLLPLARNGFGTLDYQAYEVHKNADTPITNELLNVTDITKISGYSGELRADNYAVTASASAEHQVTLRFRYRVCDQAVVQAHADAPVQNGVCTNARDVEITWDQRPHIKAATISAGTPSGRYADGAEFLKQGDSITVTLTFREASKVADGTAANQQPYIELTVGDETRRATPVTDRTTEQSLSRHTMDFRYQVQADDYAPNGVSVKTNGLQNCAVIASDFGLGFDKYMDNGCVLPTHPANTTLVHGQRRADDTAELTLDADGNGLIEISNATQLNLIRHDPDGNGQVSAESHGIYFGSNAFPDIRKSSDGTTGCPHNACAGYELTADLTLSGNFTPISAWDTVLDGKGHTIAGLNISNGNGMFERTGTASVIRNLGFASPAVDTGDEHGAIIVGHNQGDIRNVYIADATLAGDYGLALIASTHSQGTISDTYATGTVTTNSEGSVGSLVGNLQSGTLENSYSRTNIGIADGNVFLGYKVVAGWHGGNGSISNVWEAEADYPHNPLNDFTKSDRELIAATALTGWNASAWDFGDACQYPALKSGGHDPVEQTALGEACTAR